jgi:hypothetical protein
MIGTEKQSAMTMPGLWSFSGEGEASEKQKSGKKAVKKSSVRKRGDRFSL